MNAERVVADLETLSSPCLNGSHPSCPGRRRLREATPRNGWMCLCPCHTHRRVSPAMPRAMGLTDKGRRLLAMLWLFGDACDG